MPSSLRTKHMYLGGRMVAFEGRSLCDQLGQRTEEMRAARRLAVAVVSTALLIALLAGAGCSASGRLVGVWRVDGAQQKVIEFSNDGAFSSTCLGIRAGQYQVIDGGKTIEFKGEGKVVAMQYFLDGGTMKLRGMPSGGATVEWSLTRSANVVRPAK
jgi:hypothetical protein